MPVIRRSNTQPQDNPRRWTLHRLGQCSLMLAAGLAASGHAFVAFAGPDDPPPPFMDLSVEITEKGAFYNGVPIGITLGEFERTAWVFPSSSVHRLQCGNEAQRQFEISLSYSSDTAVTPSEHEAREKDLVLKLDGTVVSQYATASRPDEDGVYSQPASLYPIEALFRDVSRINLYAYQCAESSLYVWLDMDRQIVDEAGRMLAASRENLMLVLGDSGDFWWVSGLNWATPERRVAKGRKALPDASPPDCAANQWPCDRDERMSRKAQSISGFIASDRESKPAEE